MSSLRDAFASETRIKKGPPCTAGALWAELGDEERAELRGWIDSVGRPRAWGGMTWSEISIKLAAIGLPVQPGTLSRHERGLCGCDR